MKHFEPEKNNLELGNDECETDGEKKRISGENSNVQQIKISMFHQWIPI